MGVRTLIHVSRKTRTDRFSCAPYLEGPHQTHRIVPFSPCRFVNRPTCPVDPKSKKFNGSFFGLNLSNPFLVVHMNNDTFPPYCRTRPPSSDPESPTESFRPFQSLYRGTSPTRKRVGDTSLPGYLGRVVSKLLSVGAFPGQRKSHVLTTY